MTAVDRAVAAYQAQYGTEPEIVVRSPGRLNLIGEHTDYNEGFALPMAIDRGTAIAAGPRDGSEVVLTSEGHGEMTVDRIRPDHRPGDWSDYVAGVLWAGDPNGPGWRGHIASDLPLGASVSSSAALEMGLLRIEAALTGTEWDPLTASKAGALVENEWLGLGSGMLDQLAVSAATAGHATLIDFESLTWEQVPMPDGVLVVVLDTGTRRKLTESRYNDRRADCERAAAALGVPSLRHATPSDAASLIATDKPAARRAFHVTSDNERTQAAAAAMRAGDTLLLGRLMMASHVSLREDFEVSGPELDAIVEAAWDAPGCLGARMTGGGFAGCAIALVESDHVEAFTDFVIPAYVDRTGLTPDLWSCVPSDGTALL